jgi:hypothetical protein
LAEQKLTINLFLMKKRRNYWFPKFWTTDQIKFLLWMNVDQNLLKWF